MNLHALVSPVIGAINPHITITLERSSGYTTGANGKQVPAYETAVDGPGQVQALGASDLKHMNDLNIQGVMRKVYLYGNWMGVVRADQKGGDVLTFPQVPGAVAQKWKLVTVFETWPDWCAVGVVLQTGGVQ